MWMQIGQNEFDGTRWFRSKSRRSRRETLGACGGGERRAGSLRNELRIQILLNEWSWASSAGAEVNICVARYIVIEGFVESAGDELRRRGFLQKRDSECPAEGEAGLDFLAQILREPGEKEVSMKTQRRTGDYKYQA